MLYMLLAANNFTSDIDIIAHGTADEKLDLCKEENICTLMRNGLER